MISVSINERTPELDRALELGRLALVRTMEDSAPRTAEEYLAYRVTHEIIGPLVQQEYEQFVAETRQRLEESGASREEFAALVDAWLETKNIRK